MQIFADVTGKLPQSGDLIPSLGFRGAAIFAAVAAGPQRGGYESIVESAAAMAEVKDYVYTPQAEHHRVYQLLYGEYMQLYDDFGRGGLNTMKKLKRLREEVTE